MFVGNVCVCCQCVCAHHMRNTRGIQLFVKYNKQLRDREAKLANVPHALLKHVSAA
jgi:hypothetical protein